MGLFDKYTEREVMCAILAVEEILEERALGVEVGQRSKKGNFGRCFRVLDYLGEFDGGLYGERFQSLNGVLDRLNSLGGLRVVDDDCQVPIFLESVYCRDLLREITPDVYREMKGKYWGKDGEHFDRFADLFPEGERLRYVARRLKEVDALGYVVDKSIAMKIMETQSAYVVAEYGGKICEVYVDNGDLSDFDEEIKNGTLLECDGVYAVDSYWELIVGSENYSGQKDLIRDDFGDLGLFNNEGNWDFYLTEKELQYIGMGEELSMQKLIQDAELRAGEVGESGEVEREFEI